MFITKDLLETVFEYHNPIDLINIFQKVDKYWHGVINDNNFLARMITKKGIDLKEVLANGTTPMYHLYECVSYDTNELGVWCDEVNGAEEFYDKLYDELQDNIGYKYDSASEMDNIITSHIGTKNDMCSERYTFDNFQYEFDDNSEFYIDSDEGIYQLVKITPYEESDEIICNQHTCSKSDKDIDLRKVLINKPKYYYIHLNGYQTQGLSLSELKLKSMKELVNACDEEDWDIPKKIKEGVNEIYTTGGHERWTTETQYILIKTTPNQ
jgi:hypothetical protein